MKIAVIPARGGSKRIPRKNIKLFCGKPMIVRAIETAQLSGQFDRIIISTDDEEIAEIARQYDVEVPFVRPSELSNDYAGTIEVIAHATRWALDQYRSISAVCCIYAATPFLQADDIKDAWSLLESGDWAYAFPVTRFSAPIFRSFRLLESGGVEMFFPEHFDHRSQDLPDAYHDAGQFYWGRPQAWLEGKRLFAEHSYPLVIPSWRVCDIDTPQDWEMAERMYHNLTKL